MGYVTYAAARRSERQARAARHEAQLLRWQYEEDTGRLADESDTAPFMLAALLVLVVMAIVALIAAVVMAMLWTFRGVSVGLRHITKVSQRRLKHPATGPKRSAPTLCEQQMLTADHRSWVIPMHHDSQQSLPATSSCDCTTQSPMDGI